MYELRYHSAGHIGHSSSPTERNLPGGTADWAERKVDSSMPTPSPGQHKVGRRDQSQTTPRAHQVSGFVNQHSWREAPDEPTGKFNTPLRPVRTHGHAHTPVDECRSPPAASGLTPMAAQLSLSGNPFSQTARPTVYGTAPEARRAYTEEVYGTNGVPYYINAQYSRPVENQESMPSSQRIDVNQAMPRAVPYLVPAYQQTHAPQGPLFTGLPMNWIGAPIGYQNTSVLPVQPRPHDPSWPIAPGLPLVDADTDGRWQWARSIPASKDATHCPPPQQMVTRGHPVTQQAVREAAATGVSKNSAASPVTPLPQEGPPPPQRHTIRRGVSPETALRTLGHLLTSYEKIEVLGFHEIWFAGRAAVTKVHANSRNPDSNLGFDDSKGDYRVVHGDHISYRYEVLGSLGRGSFGQVLRCVDHATGTTVALKIIRNKRRFQRQAQVEASILAALMACVPGGDSGSSTHGAHSIVRMHESFSFRSHLCITFELLGANLYEHIKAGGFVGCSPSLVRGVARQVLSTLVFLRDMRIVHCDLKPENILLPHGVIAGAPASSNTLVKVIDFGSSCYADQRLFTYIQSRFYRAPEVIIGLPYGPEIDMWSLACVLAEVLTGAPLFPGEDEAEQVACIAEVLGPPTPAVLAGATRAKLFFDLVTGMPRPIPPNSQGRTHRPGALPLDAALRGLGDQSFVDFLQVR